MRIKKKVTLFLFPGVSNLDTKEIISENASDAILLYGSVKEVKHWRRGVLKTKIVLDEAVF
jgi:hypothetical protein